MSRMVWRNQIKPGNHAHLPNHSSGKGKRWACHHSLRERERCCCPAIWEHEKLETDVPRYGCGATRHNVVITLFSFRTQISPSLTPQSTHYFTVECRVWHHTMQCRVWHLTVQSPTPRTVHIYCSSESDPPCLIHGRSPLFCEYRREFDMFNKSIIAF